MKAFKIGGIALFLGVNAYMGYRLITAYDDGVERGEKMHKLKEARKKSRYKFFFIDKKKIRKSSWSHKKSSLSTSSGKFENTNR